MGARKQTSLTVRSWLACGSSRTNISDSNGVTQLTKVYEFALIFSLSLVNSNVFASANTFIREVERLIAVSDETYTVIVSQYEQTYSYWRSINRSIVRVIDINTNEVIAQVVLSSVQVDTDMEEPYETSISLAEGESPAFENLLIKPQLLYSNLEYPKYRFNIDREGVFLNNIGRQDLLDYEVVENRFANAGSDLDHPIDADYNLDLDIKSKNLEFKGWYKTQLNGKQRYFFVLKLGLYNDDTGSLEYVFSIPDLQ